MPSHYVHLFIGISSAFFLYSILSQFLAFSPELIFLIFLTSSISAVFPDIDHRNSKIHKSVKSFIILILVIYLAIKLYPSNFVLLLPFLALVLYALFSVLKPRHRGITHKFEFAALFSAVIAILSHLYFGSMIPSFFAFVSYSSHIIADKIWKY